MNDEIVVKADDKPKRENPCLVTWGNCSETEPRYWGKPTATPHTCSGMATHIRRGIGKLHACEKCKTLGSHIQPTPYSKAGAQLRAAIMASHGLAK
jgi:hypothetical protein